MIKDFRRLDRAARLLVVSAREDPLSIQRAFRAGTHGYLALEDDPAEVLQALNSIFDGHLYASASVTGRLLKSLATNELEPARSEVKPLSDRELSRLAFFRWLYDTGRIVPDDKPVTRNP